MKDCRVCCGTHDPATHEATRRVRRWAYDQMILRGEPIVKKVPNPGVAEARRLRTGIEVWPASVPGLGWVDLAR